MSRVTAIISALVICIIVCLSWAVNHYRDNAITYKAQRDKKCQRTEAGERGTTMQMRQRDVAALDAKYTKELADAKAENVFPRDDVAAGRRLSYDRYSVSQCVKPPLPPADNAASPTGRQRQNGIISPSERLITMQKQLEGTQKYINEQCR